MGISSFLYKIKYHTHPIQNLPQKHEYKLFLKHEKQYYKNRFNHFCLNVHNVTRVHSTYPLPYLTLGIVIIITIKIVCNFPFSLLQWCLDFLPITVFQLCNSVLKDQFYNPLGYHQCAVYLLNAHKTAINNCQAC